MALRESRRSRSRWVRGCRHLILVLAAAVGAVQPARGFVLSRGQSGSNWYPTRWSEQTQKVRLVMSDRPLDLLPNIASDSIPLGAVEAALRTWAFAPAGLYLDGMTAKTDAVRDGVNLITFANTARNRDVIGNAVGITTLWYSGVQRNHWNIQETDIVLNPAEKWATDGRSNVYDMQLVLTHELGHVQGLDHSPILAATMYPGGPPGQRYARSLEADDIAGIRALYGQPADSHLGAIAGRVLTTDGAAVFGGHVVAVDAEGIVRVGALTDKDGTFTLPSLPPSTYSVYAESLDAHATPGDVGSYYRNARKSFRTAFAGGNSRPAAIPVAEGETVTLDPITVEAQPATLKVEFLGGSTDGNFFPSIAPQALPVPAGVTTFWLVAGDGLDRATSISVSGMDVTLDRSRAAFDHLSNGLPLFFSPLSVRPGATPGSRSLYVRFGGEVAVYTGSIKVTAF